jgi:hypothetical protein
VGCCGLLLGRQLGLARMKQWPLRFIQIFSKQYEFIRAQDGIPVLQKFQIKYGFEGFEKRNDFL